jgi:hypothetical protein
MLSQMLLKCETAISTHKIFPTGMGIRKSGYYCKSRTSTNKRIQLPSPFKHGMGIATLNNQAPLLLEAIASAAQVRIKDFNDQELCNTEWSFAVFNRTHLSLPTLN